MSKKVKSSRVKKAVVKKKVPVKKKTVLKKKVQKVVPKTITVEIPHPYTEKRFTGLLTLAADELKKVAEHTNQEKERKEILHHIQNIYDPYPRKTNRPALDPEGFRFRTKKMGDINRLYIPVLDENDKPAKELIEIIESHEPEPIEQPKKKSVLGRLLSFFRND